MNEDGDIGVNIKLKGAPYNEKAFSKLKALITTIPMNTQRGLSATVKYSLCLACKLFII
jgi:hypothetical protein